MRLIRDEDKGGGGGGGRRYGGGREEGEYIYILNCHHQNDQGAGIAQWLERRTRD